MSAELPDNLPGDVFEECSCPKCKEPVQLVPPEYHEESDGTLTLLSSEGVECSACGWSGTKWETLHHDIPIDQWKALLLAYDVLHAPAPNEPPRTDKPIYKDRKTPRFPTSYLPGGRNKMRIMRARLARGENPTHPLDARCPLELTRQIEKARKADNGRFKVYRLVARWEKSCGIIDDSSSESCPADNQGSG